MSVCHLKKKKFPCCSDPNAAVEERKRMLSRYKEARQLQKEKEKRERERKGGVFKVGLYKPQPLAPLSQVSGAPSRAKVSRAVRLFSPNTHSEFGSLFRLLQNITFGGIRTGVECFIVCMTIEAIINGEMFLLAFYGINSTPEVSSRTGVFLLFLKSATKLFCVSESLFPDSVSGSLRSQLRRRLRPAA